MSRTDRIELIMGKVAFLSLCLLIFALPFSKSIVEITIVSSAAALVVGRMAGRKRIMGEIGGIEVALFIYILATIPSFLNTDYPALSFRAFFTKILKFAMLFLVTKEVIDTDRKLIRFLRVAFLSCIMIVIDGFVQQFITHYDILHNYPAFYYVPGSKGPTFPTASFPYPNDYAAWILIFVFPVGAFLLRGRRMIFTRVLVVATFLALLYSLMLTKVRGAWISLVAAFGAVSAFKARVAGIILIALFLGSALFVNRHQLIEMGHVTSFRDRSEMWRNSWKIFSEHPMIGNGINTFYMEYSKTRTDEYRDKKGSYAHNCYLQMAAEIGVIGLVAFLAFCVMLVGRGLLSVYRGSGDIPGSFTSALAAGVMAFLIHSFVDTNLYSLNLAALFWISCGVIAAAVNITSGKKDE